ncbi:uncharacterized protein LOC116210919 isoform X1 [Punica granatum]|uniref:Uncharacterized protein LOC116210919 isoform X1 n=1 Tax=Punica granatum TaxID=22663 RepID=A0A6P8E347_PUNGR|nr:uncharacterized protein LOC116210919 isoform X1 [Punica granatum]
MAAEKEETSAAARRRLTCSACFDALWFCYSPVHQMQMYYRFGELDNCKAKWSALIDCLSLKTKRASEVQVMKKQISCRRFSRSARHKSLIYGSSELRRNLRLIGKSCLVIWMEGNDRGTADAAAAA